MSASAHSSDKITMETPRLALRGAVSSDAEPMFEAFGDPEVMRYWSELPHKNTTRTVEWISKMTVGSPNGVTDFIITLKPDLIPIGKIGVWQGEEIGFLLAKKYWGKGLAQEAMKTVLEYLFAPTETGGRGFNRIVADVDPRNVACLGILGRFGFVNTGFEEKTFEIAGEWVDSFYLELTRERWEEMNAHP